LGGVLLALIQCHQQRPVGEKTIPLERLAIELLLRYRADRQLLLQRCFHRLERGNLCRIKLFFF
jgi:hypothetical protein